VKRTESFTNSQNPAVRERYFRSILEVRHRLANFLHDLEEPAIREGVIAKLSAIDGILLRAFIYDPLDTSALSARLSLLLAEGIFPFRPLADANTKDRFLRIAVNRRPLSFPRIYRWFRERPMLRQAMESLRQRAS